VHAQCAHRAAKVCGVDHSLCVAVEEFALQLLSIPEKLFKIRAVQDEIGKLRVARAGKSGLRFHHGVRQNRGNAQILVLAEGGCQFVHRYSAGGAHQIKAVYALGF